MDASWITEDTAHCDACLTRPALGLLTLHTEDGHHVASWWTCGSAPITTHPSTTPAAWSSPSSSPTAACDRHRRQLRMLRDGPRAARCACSGARAPDPQHSPARRRLAGHRHATRTPTHRPTSTPARSRPSLRRHQRRQRDRAGRARAEQAPHGGTLRRNWWAIPPAEDPRPIRDRSTHPAPPSAACATAMPPSTSQRRPTRSTPR